MATHLHDREAARPPAARDRRAGAWLWALVAVAWALAIIATLTGQRALVDHHYLLEESGLPWLAAALVFLAGWQVMTVAMMLPASISMLGSALSDSRWRINAPRVAVALLTGYAAIWTAFALLAFAGDTALHHTVDSWPWLAAHTPLIGASALAAAGIYQFSRLKVACLAACRHPRPLADLAGGGAGAAWRTGARFGVSSLGCCWALMLVMFGVGVGGLGWMAALTISMTLEERFARARALRLALGVALLALAALWLASPPWLPTGLA